MQSSYISKILSWKLGKKKAHFVCLPSNLSMNYLFASRSELQSSVPHILIPTVNFLPHWISIKTWKFCSCDAATFSAISKLRGKDRKSPLLRNTEMVPVEKLVGLIFFMTYFPTNIKQIMDRLEARGKLASVPRAGTLCINPGGNNK